MYASDWVFCLFSSIIPLQLYSTFLDSFLTLGWPYFYSVCLSLLTFFKARLLEEDEISGILYHIKFKSPCEHSKRSPESPSSAFVFNEETGQLQKGGSVVAAADETGFARFFRIFRSSSSTVESPSKQEGDFEEVWRKILTMAAGYKLEKVKIGEINKQYADERSAEEEEANDSTESRSGEEDINATQIKIFNKAT